MNFQTELRELFLSPYIWLFFFGALIITICLFQKGRSSQGQLSTTATVGIFFLFFAVVVSIPLVQWLTKPPEDPIPPEGGGMISGSMGPEASQTVEPLKMGEAPPLTIPAAGWINSPEGGPDLHGKVVVLDIWALWCPYCKWTAPGLVRLSQKYAGQDVLFISLTNTLELSTRPFIEEQEITWPAAYGVDLKFVRMLDAINETSPIPGYEIKPTLLILDRAGKIVWSDNHARFRHHEPEKTAAELDEAIAKALKTPR